MNPSDNLKPQTCRNCPEPVAGGSIGITSGICVSCSANHGEPQQQITSLHEGFLEETVEPESNLPQSGTEQVTGAGVNKGSDESKDDETKDADDSKGTINTGTTTPAEEESPLSNDHKRCRPASSKNSDTLKLTPACASCKKAKVRCTHRRILGEDGTVSADDQTPPRPQKKTVRLHLSNPATTEGTPEANPNAPRQTRGGFRKRKVAEMGENDTQDIFELPGDGTREESQSPGQKRARRGRKTRNYNEEATEGTDNSSDTAQATTEEPAAAAGGGIAGTGVFRITRPPFPAGNLHGSTVLARHVVLSRELQQKIDDCHAKWSAAMEGLQGAKRALDTWVDVWTRGE